MATKEIRFVQITASEGPENSTMLHGLTADGCVYVLEGADRETAVWRPVAMVEGWDGD